MIDILLGGSGSSRGISFCLAKRVIALLIVTIGIFTIPPFSHATETDWTVHIKVSLPDPRGADGTIWNHLIAGIREDATDGFDSAFDTMAMIEADDPVQAMFTHGTTLVDKNNDGTIDGWMCDRVDTGFTIYQCSLWRDTRAFHPEDLWSFLVLSPVKGATITLQWVLEGVPASMDITLVDLSEGTETDMMKGGYYSYTNSFEAGKRYGIRYFQIRTKIKGLSIFPLVVRDATLGTPYKVRLSTVEGVPVWSVEEGTLPPGLTLDPSSGEITGTPEIEGSFRFAIRCDDRVGGGQASREYILSVHPRPEIDPMSLPEGTAGESYFARLTATGGSLPLTWEIRGNLPEGLHIDEATGVISGRLIVSGVYEFTAIVKDGNGATGSRDFTIRVAGPYDEAPPAAITDLRAIYLTETSLLLQWTAPVDDGMTGTAAIYDLRYMKGCTDGSIPGWWEDAMEASGEPRPQRGALQTYTLTGLQKGEDYCVAIKSIDAAGHISPLSNVVKISGETGGDLSAGVMKSILLRKGYNFLSFPFMPVPNGRESLLGAFVGSPVGLYRWYSAYPGITPPQYYLEETVIPGLGYLLYSPSEMDLSVYGVVLLDKEYTVSLDEGWNMIGSPYPYEGGIPLDRLVVRNRGTREEKAYIDAVKKGWIGNTIYYLRDGNYEFTSFNDDPPAVIEPWVGYWIYTELKDGVDLIFRRP